MVNGDVLNEYVNFVKIIPFIIKQVIITTQLKQKLITLAEMLACGS